MPMSTLGGWHTDAYVVIAEVARSVAAWAMESYGKVRGIFMQRYAVAAAKSNADCLLAGLEPVF